MTIFAFPSPRGDNDDELNAINAQDYIGRENTENPARVPDGDYGETVSDAWIQNGDINEDAKPVHGRYIKNTHIGGN